MKRNKVAIKIAKSEERFIRSTPGAGMGYGGKSPLLKKYQGVKVGGRKYTRFSQIKVTPARKKSTKEKVAGGIRLAIL
jgi:hypothetical protein